MIISVDVIRQVQDQGSMLDVAERRRNLTSDAAPDLTTRITELEATLSMRLPDPCLIPGST